MSDLEMSQEDNEENNSPKEKIRFIINGEVVYFQDKPEVIKHILDDDEYAFIYIKKAQEEGRLSENGLSANTPIFKFSRCSVNIETEERSSMSCNPDSNLKNEIIWSHKYKGTERDIDATYDLLKIRSREDIINAFENPKIKQLTIWEKIAEALSDLGYNLGSTGAEKCRQKYINLRKTFYKYKKNLEQGKIAVSKPAPLFMEEMETLCRDKEFIPRKLNKELIHIENLQNIKSEKPNNNISDTEDNDKNTENSENILNVHDYLILAKDNEESFSENDDDNISLDDNSSDKIIKTLKDVHEKQMSFQQSLHDKLISAIHENTEQTKKVNNLLENFVMNFGKKRKRIDDADDDKR